MEDRQENTQVSSVYVKFCGFTHVSDVVEAVRLGVDAIGMVFYPGSARCVSPAQGRELARAIPASVDCVALFVNPASDEVKRVMDIVDPSVLQFHGDEEAGFCEGFGRPYWKALAMDRTHALAWLQEQSARFSQASALLLDGHAPGAMGGGGRSFNWNAVPAMNQRLILAGGLTAETVGEAIRTVKPYGVDVSSGIETQPGIKDGARMREFMQVVRATG